jgi:outer membrane protein assembly factor BamB
MDVVFAVEAARFTAFRAADGSMRWSDYDGKKVQSAFPSADGARCIILWDGDACAKPRFENLFCVDRNGKTIWTAPLPDTHDFFVEARMEPDGLHAWSWSGFRLDLDPADGHVMSREFTK